MAFDSATGPMGANLADPGASFRLWGGFDDESIYFEDRQAGGDNNRSLYSIVVFAS